LDGWFVGVKGLAPNFGVNLCFSEHRVEGLI
jgi:hypothetical protein